MFSRESNADYLNPSLPIAQRVSDLLGRMTLEEKVGQMMQLDARTGELDELIVKRHVGSILHTSPDDLVRAAQIVRNKTRLGIPLLVGDDCIHGYSFWPGATIFPSQLGMACSWDARKVEEAARITAEEVACTGVHWTFSPVLCIGRDTRWGRIDDKHIGRSLVNRNRPGSRGRIRLSLPRVKLQCLEVICPVIVSVAVHLSLPFLCSRQCQRMISGL